VRPLLIVNPAAASGRAGRRFGEIARAVGAALGEVDSRFTEAAGHAVLLAREAAGAGRSLVVAVGGDGTASEVVDGLVGAGYRHLAGFIPAGTGGDLRRSLGIPCRLADAARALAGDASRVVDVGRVEFTGSDGRPAARHFANVASGGISAVVAAAVNRSSKRLGARVAYTLASARSLARWRDVRVRWRADGGPWTEQPVTALAVCNGRFFGGGMMIAPEARLDDGWLDVTIWTGFGLLDLASKLPQVYDGRHVRLPNTRTLRARTVEVEPAGDAPVLLEVDGEQPGRLPARFTVLPGALRLRVLGPA
jgi:YegS/Rv2252/BmrU family lipid kinase